MSQQRELLRVGAKRIAEDQEYMSYVLYKYLEIEQVTEAELIDVLKCSPEDLYRLALCKVPNLTVGDYLPRLEKIAEYSHTPKEELNRIIKRVDFFVKLPSAEARNSLLMAARDKNKKE